MKWSKILAPLLIGLLMMAGLIGQRWYDYVNRAPSPYDEVGIALNSWMPGPLRQWGCKRMNQRFVNALPPPGCQHPLNPRKWID